MRPTLLHTAPGVFGTMESKYANRLTFAGRRKKSRNQIAKKVVEGLIEKLRHHNCLHSS